AREQRAAHIPDDGDPVTVVATSRGTLPRRVAAAGAATPLEAASRSDHLSRSHTGLSRLWYPVALPDLTEAEVDNMVAALELREGSNRRIAAQVYRFTRGHPGSTRLVLDAIAEEPAASVELRSVLRQPEPGDRSEGTVRQTLLKRFLRGYRPEALQDL